MGLFKNRKAEPEIVPADYVAQGAYTAGDGGGVFTSVTLSRYRPRVVYGETGYMAVIENPNFIGFSQENIQDAFGTAYTQVVASYVGGAMIPLSIAMKDNEAAGDYLAQLLYDYAHTDGDIYADYTDEADADAE